MRRKGQTRLSVDKYPIIIKLIFKDQTSQFAYIKKPSFWQRHFKKTSLISTPCGKDRITIYEVKFIKTELYHMVAHVICSSSNDQPTIGGQTHEL